MCNNEMERGRLIVSLLEKRDKENPGNYRVITLLTVVGNLFCTFFDEHLLHHL